MIIYLYLLDKKTLTGIDKPDVSAIKEHPYWLACIACIKERPCSSTTDEHNDTQNGALSQ